MTRSDVILCSWNSPAPSAGKGNTGLYLSRSVSAKQSGWLPNLGTDARTYVHCTNTCPLWPASWSTALLTHGKAYHKMSSTKQWVNGERDCVQAWGKKTSLWTTAILKPALFRSNTLHNRLFSEPPTVYRGKHVVSLHFHCSHWKANKVSKSEGTKKLKYAYHFLKCADAVDWKLSCLWKLQLPKSAHCFETQCVNFSSVLGGCTILGEMEKEIKGLHLANPGSPGAVKPMCVSSIHCYLLILLIQLLWTYASFPTLYIHIQVL